MIIFGSLVAILAVFVDSIDCFRVRQLPPSGQLPGHPDHTFFTVSPEDLRDVYVQVDNGLFIPVQEPLLVVSKNDDIIGWMDQMTFCPIYNEDRQKITISMETGRFHLTEIDNQCLRERSRTPPNYIRNRQDRSGTSPNHNPMTRDCSTTFSNNATAGPDFPRSPPKNNTSMQNRSNFPPIYDTIMRDRSITPLNQVTADEDPPRTPPESITIRNDRSETPPNHYTFIRQRSRSPLNRNGTIQGPPTRVSSKIEPPLDNATCTQNLSKTAPQSGTDNLDRSRERTDYGNVIRERSRSPRKHGTYQSN